MPDSIYLRPEARPVHWSLLDRTQRQAFDTVLKTLMQAGERLPSPTPRQGPRQEDPGRWLSPQRSSQILFLDGARGTGKTTVLTSLIDASREDPEARRPARPPVDGSRPPDPAALQWMRTRVVWLEPLDMEPAPSSLNLLPAILARVDAAAYRLGVGGAGGEAEREPTYLGSIEPGAELQDALIQLQRFQASSALAWASNLEARAASLDPDSYAIEVMRAERARLSVNRTLEMVLDALAYGAFRGPNVRNPLFVLPIDDFDLNPSTSLALLQLLRMISVPRLFTLVLGDLNVAKVIVNLKLSSDLAAVAEVAARARLLSVPPSTITALGADLAANVLRKLIPPGQRVALRHLSRVEALNLRPLGSGDSDPRLHGLMGRCPVALDPGPYGPIATVRGTIVDNLRDFLLVPRLSFFPQPRSPDPKSDEAEVTKPDEAELNAGDLAECIYSGLTALSTTPRQATDLWLALQRSAEALDPQSEFVESARTLDVVADYCQLSLAEERAFSPEESQAAVSAVQREPTEEWSLEAVPVAVRYRINRLHSLQVRLPGAPPGSGARIHVHRILGWSFETESPGRRLARTLAEDTGGALTLFHDLVALSPSSRVFISPLIKEDSAYENLVVLEVAGPPGRTAALPWPVPPFTSFWELDQFRSAWDEANREESPDSRLSPRSIAELASAWIAAGSAILIGTGDVPFGRSGPQSRGAWEKSMHALVYLAVGQTARAAKAREWLTRIALLLMPESGLGRGAVNLPIDVLKAYWSQEREAELIRLRRQERLSEIAASGRPDVAEGLRRAPMPAVFTSRHRPESVLLAEPAEPAGPTLGAPTASG